MLKINKMDAIKDNTITINGTTVARLSDSDTEKLLAIIKGMVSDSEPASEKKSVNKSKSKDYSVKSDKSIEFKVVTIDKKHYIQPVDHLGKRTFKALSDHLKMDYVKGCGYQFKTKKEATEFAKTPVVLTAEYINGVKLAWEE